MAEEPTSQSLSEFIQHCIDDLGSGILTPEEAFVAMRQYAPLRYVLDRKKEDVALKLAGGEDIKQLLVEILKLEIPAAGKEPNPLDEAKSPAEIAARAQVFARAQKQIPEAARQRFEQERKTYARRVASTWVAELRNRRLYNATPQEEQGIVASVENLPPTASAAETKNLVTAQLQSLAQTNPNLSRGQEALAQIAQTTELADPVQIQQQMTKVVLDNPELTKPDLLVGLVAQGVDASRAVSLTRVAEGLSLDINPAVDVTRPSVFFQAVAKSPFQKLVAPAADAILTVLPQGTREQIIESILTKSWERVTQNLDQKFGTAVVSSPVFQEALAHGNHALEKPTTPGGAAAGLSKFFGDAFSTVFGRGVDQAMMEKYLELGKTTTITQQLAWRHFYTAFAHSYNPSLFSFALEGGKWALGKIGGGAVKKVVGAAARGIAAKLSGTAIGAAIGSIIPGAGTIVGAAIGFLGDKVLGGLWRGAKTLFGGGLITRLFTGGTGRWQDDFPLVATIIVLLPVIILFLFPTFLNPQFIGTTSQSSALVDMEAGGGEIVGPLAPPPGGGALQCLNTRAPGVSALGSQALSPSQENKINQVLNGFPSLGLMNCVLGCPATRIAITAINQSSPEGYGGWAPGARPGNIVFYLPAFRYSDRTLAYALAHELGHQINWFHPDIYSAFIGRSTTTPGAHCRRLSTYRWAQDSHETFAEAAALYIMGSGALQRECPGAYTFMQNLFTTCR